MARMVDAADLPAGGPWPATRSTGHQAWEWWRVNVNGTIYARHTSDLHFAEPDPDEPGLAPGIDPGYAAWMGTGSD
jgi:hypothetical protein